MRLAVMQPYFFPYIGYFQLVRAVDDFVFFDDVNFIKKGWINRNQLLQKDHAYSFTIPLVKASQNRKINETEIAGYEAWKNDFLRSIEFNYKKAPHFSAVHALLKDMLETHRFTMISELAAQSVITTARYLGLNTRFHFSGRLSYQGANGQEKILSLCNKMGATMYVNPKNGMSLYNEGDFLAEQIDLRFIIAGDIRYRQFPGNEFVPWLSMIDVLMFNSPEETNALLENYDLVKKPS